MKKYPDITLVDSTLLSLWNLFDKSPKKLAMLENVQEISGQKALKMIMPSTTSWLSHRDCCLRVHARYSEIIDALDQAEIQRPWELSYILLMTPLSPCGFPL